MNQQVITKWGTIAVAAIAGTWMRIPHTIQILLWLMLWDIISGVFAAIVNHALNSSVMVAGLVKKLAAFPFLAMLHLVEKPLNLPFEFEMVAALGLIVYEAMSIIENSARAGLPIPQVIVSAFAKVKIQTATADEIQREFSTSDQTKVSVNQTSEIVKTPDSQPDLKVDKKITVLEEQHVTPVIPPKE